MADTTGRIPLWVIDSCILVIGLIGIFNGSYFRLGSSL